MTKRARRQAALFALCLGLSGPLAPGQDSSRRPNILLIVSEDNGPELGSYGDPYARTPVLDRLAARGVRFANAYVPQAGCSQSRAAFLTGLYPHQSGQIGLATWQFGLFRADTPNLVRSLKAAGYRTGIVGKLHINPAAAFPFDTVEIPNANFKREDLGSYARISGRFFRESEVPFFLSVNYPDAHRPFLPQVGGLPVSPRSPREFVPLRYMGLDSPTLRRDTANYYNALSRLDSLVGQLLDELDRSGKSDNTLVVYLGDHGADLLRGKRTCYEGGVRIPLIIRWPGRQKTGWAADELVSTIDLVPTLLEAAGAVAIPGLPGRSLVQLIAGQTPAWREYLYTEYHLHSNHNYYPQRAVRGQRYKLIRNLMPNEANPGPAFTISRFVGPDEMREALTEAAPAVRAAYERMEQPPEFELYDLQDDPFEFRNLASNPAQAGALHRLQAALADWRQRTADPFLDPAKVRRLKAEIDSTYRDGQYQRPIRWQYVDYLAPAEPPR